MATNAPPTAQQTEQPPTAPEGSYRRESDESEGVTVPPEKVLELLGDEYTRAVLGAVLDEARTGREIIESTDVSKATVYRRLNALQEAGIVESSMRIDPGGHHCEEFRAVADRLDFQFGSDGFSARLACEESLDSPEQLPFDGVPADD